MSGIALIITFVAAVILMIAAISKWKIHPFISITGVSILLALVVGLPLETIPTTIGKGFSSIFASIGLVIIFGTLIGVVLEKTGAAVRLADSVLRLIGPKHPQLAMLIIGWIVAVPVFCDSGFVILNPIRKSLTSKTGVPSASMVMALSAGLFAAHVLLPPGPGPLGAAGLIGMENHLLIIIGLGVIVSIFALVPAYFYAVKAGARIHTAEDDGTASAENDSALLPECGTLPSLSASLAPILVPILLIAASSIATTAGGSGKFYSIAVFLGKPVIALIVGFLCSMPLLVSSGKFGELYNITNDCLKTAGPIIFVTAAGSVLGQVIVEAGFVGYIQEHAGVLSAMGVFFPFLIAAILKSAQGSSTVAMTTTAGIMGIFSESGTLMSALGMTTPIAAALVIMAIAAGSMVVSHANDSYFWVVAGFGNISAQDGYRTQTVVSLIEGVSAITAIFILSLILL